MRSKIDMGGLQGRMQGSGGYLSVSIRLMRFD